MFAGWVVLRGNEFSGATYGDAQEALATLTRFRDADRVGVLELPGFTGVQTLVWNTPESHDELTPSVCPETGNVLLSWLRLDNRDELIRELSLTRRGTVTDPDIVLAGYRRWGVDCAEHLEGDFALAIWDAQGRTVYLARDSSGVKPLFYAQTDQIFGFATTVAAFRVFRGVDLAPSSTWMTRYIAQASDSYTDTAFDQVKKLAPGHWMVLGTSGGVEMRKYHEFLDDAPWSDVRDPVWVAEYRALLESAVSARIRSSFPLGVETTGGLDSSAILGLILKLDPGQRATLQTFGQVGNELEPEFILETSRAHRVNRNNILTQYRVDPLRDHERGWEVLGHPIEHLAATSYMSFYEMAAESGIRTLHSGFGGDEVVTNSAARLISELLKHRQWRLVAKELPGSWIARPARMAKHELRRRRASDHDPELLQVALARLDASVVREDFLRDAHVRERLLDEAGYGASYDSVNSHILEYRMAAFMATRTEQCSVLADSYGIDYRWPLLDRRLMQQYLSTPAIEKRGEGFGRYLHRRAVTDVVPEKVLWKRSKNMGRQTVPMSGPSGFDLGPPLPWSDIHPALQEIVDPDKWLKCTSMPAADSSSDVRAWETTFARAAVRRLNRWLHSR